MPRPRKGTQKRTKTLYRVQAPKQNVSKPWYDRPWVWSAGGAALSGAATYLGIPKYAQSAAKDLWTDYLRPNFEYWQTPAYQEDIPWERSEWIFLEDSVQPIELRVSEDGRRFVESDYAEYSRKYFGSDNIPDPDDE